MAAAEPLWVSEATAALCAAGKNGGRVQISESGALIEFLDPKTGFEALTFYFYEGREAALQEQLFERLGQSPYARAARETMLAVLEEPYAPEELARRCATPAAERSCAYYMLCDGEELGTAPDGSMDGDLRIRRRAESWCLTVLGAPVQRGGYAAAFVEFSGVLPDGEAVGRGCLHICDGPGVTPEVYQLYGLEADDARVPCSKNITLAIALSDLATVFQGGDLPEPLD